ncbi:hypothetical protein HPB52_000268 [Rhipicephalus sanguineus]|uniref:Uncharacterized protein n=1 Tax=Rhipicephalus sanguineus TaxID=34632 RepID=A0A9D4SRP1_RHISA|nr:hypothetical protein HPB52_000268 [Rhipicephalus sanguineus]
MEALQTTMAAMQLTIKQQRGVIDQQRDAITRLQERGTGIEANNNKMARDAEEEDSGIRTNNMGSTAINTTTPKIFQLTAKTRTPTRAKKIDRISRIIKKWGKVLEGLEQRTLTKCAEVVQQQQAQLIQLQSEQALERALSPEMLQPLLDSSPPTTPEIARTDGPSGRDSNPTNSRRRHADAARVPGTRLPPSTRTCGKGAAQGVCTFIRKGIAHVKHQQFLGSRDTAIELCVTELAISGKGRGARDGKKRKTTTTVFLANTYSNPRHGKQNTTGPGQERKHRELRYTTTTTKGRDLLEDATEAEFTLLTNPAHPSRIGTSAARDTNPDLAFAMLLDGGTARWKNTGINLGRDHFIIEIELPLAHLDGNPNRSKTTTQKLVDSGKFRNTELRNIDNIDDCLLEAL